MAEHGVSSTTLNATLSGLRFFFETTVDRPEVLKKVRPESPVS
jgi:hypothetical protein